MRARAIHGVLGSLAMVILFPMGSIFMRVIPGRFAIWAHALAQLVSLIVYIGAVGMGIYLVQTVRIPGQGSMVRHLPLLAQGTVVLTVE